MISFFGLNSSQTILTKALPNEPVPPVTRIVLPLRSARGERKSRRPKAARSSNFWAVCITLSRIWTYGSAVMLGSLWLIGGQRRRQRPQHPLDVLVGHGREQGQGQDRGVEGLGARQAQ